MPELLIAISVIMCLMFLIVTIVIIISAILCVFAPLR